MVLCKIKTQNGNFFVFQQGDGLEFAEGVGYYATADGKFLEQRDPAEIEVEWVMEDWSPKPEIEDAEEEIFGHLFAKEEDSETEEEEQIFVPASHNPFEALQDLLQGG